MSPILASKISPCPRAALDLLKPGENIMYQVATTFEGYLQIMAAESPHALILDWWSRLELAIQEYSEVLGVPLKASMLCREQTLGADPKLGPELTAQLRELRLIRNEVAHDKRKPISVNDASQYARKANTLIWILARAQSS